MIMRLMNFFLQSFSMHSAIHHSVSGIFGISKATEYGSVAQ